MKKFLMILLACSGLSYGMMCTIYAQMWVPGIAIPQGTVTLKVTGMVGNAKDTQFTYYPQPMPHSGQDTLGFALKVPAGSQNWKIVPSAPGYVFDPTCDTSVTGIASNVKLWFVDSRDSGSHFWAGRDTMKPKDTLNAPRGGEAWISGSTHTITWTAHDNGTLASRVLYLSTGAGYVRLDSLSLPGYPAADVKWYARNTWQWKIDTSISSPTCRIKLVCYDTEGNWGADSSGLFVISKPTAVGKVQQPALMRRPVKRSLDLLGRPVKDVRVGGKVLNCRRINEPVKL